MGTLEALSSDPGSPARQPRVMEQGLSSPTDRQNKECFDFHTPQHSQGRGYRPVVLKYTSFATKCTESRF
jgi:hypothetical protein